jgi:Formin Homology 2 Domain
LLCLWCHDVWLSTTTYEFPFNTQAKAFDKKTSVLHYVVKLVKKNDESLISFESDLSHVIPAENVLLDAVSGDVKATTEELKEVLEIVRNEAQRLEEAGELRKMTLSELVEQKTMVHHVGIVPQFNKIAHLTGRTSMERFTLNAKLACEQASESINNVQKKYALVLAYFGEDENMSTGDFFGILRRFMAEWKKAVEQVDKIEKAQVRCIERQLEPFTSILLILLFSKFYRQRKRNEQLPKRPKRNPRPEQTRGTEQTNVGFLHLQHSMPMHQDPRDRRMRMDLSRHYRLQRIPHQVESPLWLLKPL